MSAQHAALAAMYVPLLLFGASVGGYWARAPLGPPEAPETVQRRQLFRDEHLGQWRAAVIVTGALSATAIAVVIALSV